MFQLLHSTCLLVFSKPWRRIALPLGLVRGTPLPVRKGVRWQDVALVGTSLFRGDACEGLGLTGRGDTTIHEF